MEESLDELKEGLFLIYLVGWARKSDKGEPLQRQATFPDNLIWYLWFVRFQIWSRLECGFCLKYFFSSSLEMPQFTKPWLLSISHPTDFLKISEVVCCYFSFIDYFHPDFFTRDLRVCKSIAQSLMAHLFQDDLEWCVYLNQATETVWYVIYAIKMKNNLLPWVVFLATFKHLIYSFVFTINCNVWFCVSFKKHLGMHWKIFHMGNSKWLYI